MGLAVQGSKTFISLNSRLESNNAKEGLWCVPRWAHPGEAVLGSEVQSSVTWRKIICWTLRREPLTPRRLNLPCSWSHTPTSSNVCAVNSDIDIKILFLKLIPLEHTPLLACFVFVVRPKLLLFRRINFRKQHFYIDIGVKIQGAVGGIGRQLAG